MARLAVIGAGMMGRSLARGLLGSGWSAADLVLADVSEEALRSASSELGVSTTTENRQAVDGTKGVLLAVKPQDASGVLDGLRGVVSADVLSIVAGLKTETIEEGLGDGTRVVRAMPNTPARVGKGVTALAAGTHANTDTRELADEVFGAVGPVVWVPEDALDTVTALSGSGPAYVFLVAEAMVEAGVALGLSREVASTLAFSTIEGAGTMLTELGEHPAVLRAQVTSPGGTTAAALQVLEAFGLRAAFGEAIRAAEKRSRELG